MQPALVHPTHARINLEAFRNNYRVVQSMIGPDVRIMPIVKANAYGHGMIQISQAAIQEGAEILGVARSTEAFWLRESGIRHRILIFEIVPREHEEQCIRSECELTIITEAAAKRVSDMAQRIGTIAHVQVKVDTGMGRLGIPHDIAPGVVASIARLPNLSLEGLYSHFATSEDTDQTFALDQLARFLVVRDALFSRGIKPPLIHMANSGAIITLPQAHFTMVRPGLLLYGYTPRRGMAHEVLLKPVLSLHSIVTLVKTVPVGTSISYGRRFLANRKTQIATIPIGYADGFSRLLSNCGSVLIRGQRYGVVGTVSMDHIMVDVGPGGDVKEGDEVLLIGRDQSTEISCWDIAELMHTIPYEVTCLLGSRIPRVLGDVGHAHSSRLKASE